MRLQNEQIGFIERKEYETNGKTTLKYRVIETVNGKVQVSDQKELEFPIPSVEGYLGELTFLKQDNRGNALAGAEFTLTHSDNCKICRGNGTQVSILPQEAVSGDDGKVSFTGHSLRSQLRSVGDEGSGRILQNRRALCGHGDI